MIGLSMLFSFTKRYECYYKSYHKYIKTMEVVYYLWGFFSDKRKLFVFVTLSFVFILCSTGHGQAWNRERKVQALPRHACVIG